MATFLLALMAVVALCLGVVLIPMMIAAFLQMLPYLLVLAVLWWFLR